MSNTFYWKGGFAICTTGTGARGLTSAGVQSSYVEPSSFGRSAIDGGTLGTAEITNRLESTIWNVPSNWLVRIEGGASGPSGEGVIPGQFNLQPTTLCPGGDDAVVFDYLSLGEGLSAGLTHGIPLSPCRLGGRWNEHMDGLTAGQGNLGGARGWVGAANTGGSLQSIEITERYGRSMRSSVTDNGYHSLLGFFESVDGSIGIPGGANDWGRYKTSKRGWGETVTRLSINVEDLSTVATDQLVGPAFGTGGDPIDGLRIFTQKLEDKSFYPISRTFVDSSMDLAEFLGENGFISLAGGTYQQIVVSSTGRSQSRLPYSISEEGGRPFHSILEEGFERDAEKDKYAAHIDFSSTPDDKWWDPTGRWYLTVRNMYVGSMNSIGGSNTFPMRNYVSQRSKLRFEPTKRCGNFIVNAEFRPSDTEITGAFSNFYVYPEVESVGRPGFNSGLVANVHYAKGGNVIEIGKSGQFYASGNTGGSRPTTVDNLYIRDNQDPQGSTMQNVIPFEDVATQPVVDGISKLEAVDVGGSNNMVGMSPANGDLTVGNVELEAGRLLLGTFVKNSSNNDNGSNSLVMRGFPFNKFHTMGGGYTVGDGQEKVNILRGTFFDTTHFDGRIPSDQSRKALKIGAGVSHPSESAGEIGIKILGSDARVFLSDDLRFVADYKSDQTGVTKDITGAVPVTAFRRKPSTNP